MKDLSLCPYCGEPIASSIRNSLERFLEGYIICRKCLRRINLEEEYRQVDAKKEKTNG